MQKINAANWISAARSCAPASTPYQPSYLSAMSERRQTSERSAPAAR